MIFEHTLVATKPFGTPVRRVSRSGAPLAARPQPQNTTDSWPQSGRVLGLVVMPRQPARRGPGEAQEPPKERETRRTAWMFEKLLKTTFLKRCTLSSARPILAKKGPRPNANHDGVLCLASWPYEHYLTPGMQSDEHLLPPSPPRRCALFALGGEGLGRG
jgi:hypothetical protein